MYVRTYVCMYAQVCLFVYIYATVSHQYLHLRILVAIIQLKKSEILCHC